MAKNFKRPISKLRLYKYMRNVLFIFVTYLPPKSKKDYAKIGLCKKIIIATAISLIVKNAFEKSHIIIVFIHNMVF